MSKDKVINELRLEIQKKLKECDGLNTPNVCKTIRSKQGYRKIEEMIISTMIHGQLTVGAAIAQIEMELK
jgi:hypothetical protein